MREAVHSNEAPTAMGPYSQATKAQGSIVFASGQIPVDPKSGEIVSSEVAEQTRQCLRNLSAVLVAAGAELSDVVKTTVFIQDMGDFGMINDAYAEFFKDPAPARACVEVARLPKDALVEIDAIAVVD